MSLLATLALAFVASPVRAEDPNIALQEITKYRADAVKKAQEAKTTPDYDAINAQIKKMANDAINGLNAKSINPKNGYAWMQLTIQAQKYDQIKALCDKFMESSPTPAAKFNAEFTCIQAMLSMNAADGGNRMLSPTFNNMEPASMSQFSTLVSYGAYYGVNEISQAQGINAGLKFLDGILAKQPEPKTDQEKTLLSSALRNAYETKAELLADSGYKNDAMNVLKLAKLDTSMTDTDKTRLKSAETRIGLIGSVAPVVAPNEVIGSYSGLDSMKGKVVMIDFFAHWCGPCIRAFPDMIKMYDDLHDKGLEIVSVTRYYGYYKTNRGIEPAAEFNYMKEFKKEHNMKWDVAYVDPATFTSYGVTGIPSLAVVGKDGQVEIFHVGYSPESFAELRKKVEAMLAN